MTDSINAKPLISVVIPCLNEEKTIGLVVQEAQQAFLQAGHTYEVLVADNGSTDRSRSRATAAGARIIDVRKRGYGVALRTAIQKARGPIVVFADADMTYDLKEGPMLVKRLLAGDVDLVIGSRFTGSIEKGAMPWWHLYIGTPTLTRLIRMFFGAALTDSNSGFRAFHAKKFLSWRIRSDGMEICSEVIVNCLRNGGRIAEIPITLRKGDDGRTPHLSTWRDGMRNLLIIFSRAPHVFTYLGTSLLVISLVIAIPSSLLGHTTIGPFSIFEHHSMILAILVGFLGSQSMFYGLLLDASSVRPLKVNRWLLDINEVRLLQLLGALLVIISSFIGFLFIRWVQHHFNHINYLLPGLIVLYVAIVIGSLGFGTFIVQVQKRAPSHD